MEEWDEESGGRREPEAEDVRRELWEGPLP